MRTIQTTDGTVTWYDEADATAFHMLHNARNGCQLARTAGSCTLECDTHHASLTVHVRLPEI